MDSKLKKLKPQPIHYVSETDSEEFNLLSWALSHSIIIGLDAEWKSIQKKPPPFPTVSLLQIACRLNENSADSKNDMLVFVVDLLSIPLTSIWELLKDMFISPDILKLGFQFNQDLRFLSATFCAQGCNPGFDRVEPYLDILKIYHLLKQQKSGGQLSKENKGLAFICEELLGVLLNKELQCSDWSHRPLTEDQKIYAAGDAQCLLEIFTVFQANLKEVCSLQNITEPQLANKLLGSKEILVNPDASDLMVKFNQASDMVSSTIVSDVAVAPISKASCIDAVPLGVSLSKIVSIYSETLLLKEGSGKAKNYKEKGKKQGFEDKGNDVSPKDKLEKLKPQEIHLVTETDSKEFNLLIWALSCSSVVGLDAEWKRGKQPPLPTVSLLQIACRISSTWLEYQDSQIDTFVFLIDLMKICLSSIDKLLRDIFISPDILKLGFSFQQDLVYLSSTFRSHGCNPDFYLIQPYIDISSIERHLQQEKPRGMLSKNIKSLEAVCKDVLGVTHPKELRYSDWSQRPLTENQKIYAAANAQCLLEIFTVFQGKIIKEGYSSADVTESQPADTLLGMAEILVKPDASDSRLKACRSSDIVKPITVSEIAKGPISGASCLDTLPFSDSLLEIVKRFGDSISLKEFDREPKTPKVRKKGQSLVGLEKKQPSVGVGYKGKGKRVENATHWQGPPPWDVSLGGDGCPKFLCDGTVGGLAKALRCVGIDAAIPHSQRPKSRDLINHALEEKRVLLIQAEKLMRLEKMKRNQAYRVKSLRKDDQLLEMETHWNEREIMTQQDQAMTHGFRDNNNFIHSVSPAMEAVMYNRRFRRPELEFDETMRAFPASGGNFASVPFWGAQDFSNSFAPAPLSCPLSLSFGLPHFVPTSAHCKTPLFGDSTILYNHERPHTSTFEFGDLSTLQNPSRIGDVMDLPSRPATAPVIMLPASEDVFYDKPVAMEAYTLSSGCSKQSIRCSNQSPVRSDRRLARSIHTTTI